MNAFKFGEKESDINKIAKFLSPPPNTPKQVETVWTNLVSIWQNSHNFIAPRDNRRRSRGVLWCSDWLLPYFFVISALGKKPIAQEARVIADFVIHYNLSVVNQPKL